MEDFLNAVRREAARVANGHARPRLALVDSYDPDRHAVKVRLQPDDVLTGWIPWASVMAGNGWGIFAPPSPGDQVLVSFQEGGVEAGVAHGALWNDADRPVVQDDIGKGCPSGEVWIVHKSGARIRLLNDGTMELRQQQGTQARLNPDGTVDINGTDLRIGGLGAAFYKLVDERFVQLFNGHQHPDAQGGLTGPPTQPMAVGQHTTTNLRGA